MNPLRERLQNLKIDRAGTLEPDPEEAVKATKGSTGEKYIVNVGGTGYAFRLSRDRVIYTRWFGCGSFGGALNALGEAVKVRDKVVSRIKNGEQIAEFYRSEGLSIMSKGARSAGKVPAKKSPAGNPIAPKLVKHEMEEDAIRSDDHRMALRGRLKPDINPVSGVQYFQYGSSSLWRCSWSHNGKVYHQDYRVSDLGYDEARLRALKQRHEHNIKRHGDRYLTVVESGSHDPFPGVATDKRPPMPAGRNYFSQVERPASRGEGEFEALPGSLPLGEVQVLHFRVMKAKQLDRASALHDLLMGAMMDDKEMIDISGLTIARYNELFTAPAEPEAKDVKTETQG